MRGTGSLEDIFMQTVPVEHDKILRAYTSDSRTHMGNRNIPIGFRWNKEIMLPPNAAEPEG